MKVYIDNAASTPVDDKVLQLMVNIIQNHYGNASSIHAQGRKAKSIIEDARKKVAKILNASVGEIFFTGSATEANNTILTRCVKDLGVKTIISSPLEHDCILRTLERLGKEEATKVKFLDVDQNGDIQQNQLKEIIQENIGHGQILVTLMHGNNEIGTLNDIALIGSLCKEAGVLFHSDAVQTIGKLEIDLQKTYLSFLSGTAHKFHGPKGVGFFYMNNNNIIQPLIVGGAQERNMRAGTENTPGIAGLAEALQIYHEQRQTYVDHILALRDYFEKELQRKLPDVVINAINARNRLPHISSVSFPDSSKVDLLIFNLDINGICASSGSACSSGIEHDSHVLVAIGHPTERKTVRFSFSHYNTLEEVNYVIDTLCKLQ